MHYREMRVYFPDPPSAQALADLRKAAPAGVEIFSETRPDDFEVMVEGRPEPSVVEIPSLRAVIIPFAGVPPPTLELLRANPHIEGYNLHHNAADTAEVALALLFAASKQVVRMDEGLRKGYWLERYGDSRTASLAGKKAVVLGYGEIGRRIAKALVALEMEVVAVRRSGGGTSDGPVRLATTSELRSVLPSAQVLMIAIPMTPETTGLIGRAELASMPQGSILVNVARGPIVDEEALFEALRDGHLHSAGLDVWYQYPKEESSELAPSRFPFGELENVVLSPHRAGTSMDTETHRNAALARAFAALAEGREAPNRIRLDAGY